MKLKKVTEGKTEIDYLLIEGTLDLNSQYFKTEIDKGIKQNNNNNFNTNVKGYMTSWKYFNSNKIFIKNILPLFDYLDTKSNIKQYSLTSSWGLKNSFGDYTAAHDHAPCYLSGVIYLNDHNQVLLFPEIKKQIKPTSNSFVVFSSFLIHKTNRNTTDIDKYAISFNLTHKEF